MSESIAQPTPSQNDASIDVLLIVKHQLEKLPIQQRSPDYTNILSQVNMYLCKYCNHVIENDLIDIDPGRSIEIQYCTICETTFY
jgi:uncharacterized protein YlaN (UPF0358 family)